MAESVMEPLRATLLSGFVGQGPRVEEFEHALARRFDNEHVLAVNNGTSALHLALRLANVGQGDEVITTPLTCTATNMPILERGARIVWSDINPKTGNLDPWSIEPLITEQTKAIVCVDFGGYPSDLEDIMSIGEEYGIPVIEDAAHAFGAEYQGKRIGSIADLTCFSFQAIKTLTTVDGGALTTKNADAYRRGKLLRWYGIDREQPRADFRCEANIPEFGYKMHMNDVTATIGLEQLKHVDRLLAVQRMNARYYDIQFEARALEHVRPLAYRNDRRSSYWLYPLLVDDRDSFMRHMAEGGIQVSRVHARNDKHTCFATAGNRHNLPGVDEFDAHQCSIPVGWWVTPSDREAIMAAIEEWEHVHL